MANPTLAKHFGPLPPTTTASGSLADSQLDAEKVPFTTGDPDPMTISGTTGKTAALLALVVASGTWGWSLVDPDTGSSAIPGWWFIALIGAVILAIVTAFKPRIARFTGPLYAVTMGSALGVISHLYNAAYNGIVLQAILATSAVFMVMLVLFVTGTIKVTDRFRGVVIGATVGIFVFYLATLLLSLVGISIPLVSGPFGILVSVFIVSIAAL
ncbi:MAG: Bax inhibitor-1/YccA family protein, partial [Proteobacteria bacterium]|nr:Bax inhibitor-1/YccA family protein [Pseudomonadota bacterium]